MINNNTTIGSAYGSAIGDNARVYNNNNYYGDIQEEFVELTLDKLKSQFDNSPDIETDFLNQLDKQRLLVLSGNLIEKKDLALQLALNLAEKVVDSNNRDIHIKQWKRSSSQQLINLEIVLRNTKSPTIFVLTDVEPKDIGVYAFPQIYKTAKLLDKHWVIASTEISFTHWNLGEKARIFFPELKIESIYGQDILQNKLQEELEKYSLQKELDPKSLGLVVQNLKNPTNIFRFIELFRQEVDKNTNESESKPIDINLLIELAKNDEQFIRKLYYEVLDPREQLLALGLSFFNGFFEDQLFAALEQVVMQAWRKRDPSLPVLDYCDLDKLRDNYFQLSQNDLYESTSGNFKIVEIKTYKIDLRSIKIISLENHHLLYKVAWESHRRQIINALEVLVDIVKESAIQANHDLRGKWQLYGEPLRRENLYSVISQTISDIGLVSTSALSAIQGALFRLAIDPNHNVRNVAASAIARWYNSDNRHEEELFRTLQFFYSRTLTKEGDREENYWYDELEKNREERTENSNDVQTVKNQNNQIKQNIFDHFRDDKDKQNKKYYINQEIELQDYIGATVAVTVGDVISDYYGTDTISDELYNWLEELSESRLRLVHLYFGYYTLFWVVPLHLKEQRMSTFLKEIALKHTDWLYPNSGAIAPGLAYAYNEIKWKHRDWLYHDSGISLNHAIASSLAHAYKNRENCQEVKLILDSWYDEVKHRPSNINRKKITPDDALLRTVVLTYGLIQYTQEATFITVDMALKQLEEILKKEEHPDVRKAIISAICNITYRYFNQIESQLQDLLPYFNRKEQKKIVGILCEIFLEQRETLDFEETEIYQRKIKVNRRSYKIWKNPETRPLTEIEKVMNRWAKLEKKVSVQQMAIQALVSFTSALG